MSAPTTGDGYARSSRLISGALTLGGFVTHAALAGSVGAGTRVRKARASPTTCRWLSRLMYAIAIVCGAWFVAPKAWFAVRRLRPDMNLLMTIAVVGAVLIGEWFEAATVSFLFALSLALEAWSVSRARHAVAALMALSPTVVRVLEDGRVVERAPADVAVGTPFGVRPGDKVPLDGRVIRGTSEVNQAPITGESIPVLKQTGDAVFAGTINGDGALEVESTKPAGDTTLAHIVSAGRGGAKPACAVRAVGRAIRARLHTDGLCRGDCRRDRCRRCYSRGRGPTGPIVRSCCSSSAVPARSSSRRR